MMTGTSSMPCESWVEPKVKRRTAEMVSMPTVPRASPIATITKANMTEPPDSRESSISPATARAKYSGGPKRRAWSASQEEASMIPTTPTDPAMKEPTAATASAAPARPLRVIW
jgi:hypothetical protein